AFRDDLDALLELRPPSARPAGPLERAFGWLRRHRGVAAALALVLAAGGTLAVADLVGRVDRGRRHADALADADAAAARGDFDAALSALARAAALDVDPGEVRAREAAVVERRRADRVAKAIADATDARARYEAAREAWRTLGAELDPLRAAWTSRPLTDAETRRRLDGERRHAALGRAAEEAFFRCVEAARVARTLDEGNADADRVLASLYAARYEEAAGRRDREEAAAWSDAVRRHDRDGRFAALLDATGRVSFRRAPADATIRLHRVRALDELEDGGAPRLVPVPRGDDAPPVRPGATVLEVVAAAEGLAPGDLVLALDGHPAATTTWVAASADPRLVPGDVVREIDGAPVDDARSARAALAVARRRAAAVTVTVDRDGARHEVTFDAPAPSDLELDAGPERLRRAGGRARVLRDGRIDERPLAPGVETCATAAPLLPTPSSVLVGDEATLPAGTWVARGTADGHEPLRVVFLVEPDGDATVDVDLLPVGSTPPGFVRIPAGVLRTGGDPEAQNAWPDGRREVAEFLIARFPVPCAAYAEFLNDPAILARIDRFDAPIGYPRAPQNFSTGGFWSRDADGRFVVPPLERRWPIYGISRQDAGEYARWLSARAAEAGDPFRYVLPTEEQWERAARGVDRRRFAHGDVFVPRWIDSLWDAEIADIDPIGACPLDESPFGVHDVTGGVFEWCRGTIEEGMDPLRGGGWSNAFPQFYRLATRIAAAPDWSNASTGMRLVAERATR
ncbi:MAG: SUMF1/EgtB/PvdO family nonheme iron enzyme, partial [Planctomycetota bacterium JB042]